MLPQGGKIMEDANRLLERAEHYRLLIKSVADDLAIHAMCAMAEDLEKQAAQLKGMADRRSPER